MARANVALRQSIDALTAQPSLETFLSAMLQAIAEVLEVPSACLWQFDEEMAYLQLVYQNGRVIPGEQSDHVNAKQPTREVKAAWDAVKRFTAQPYFHHINAPAVEFTVEQRAMFQRLVALLQVKSQKSSVFRVLTKRFTESLVNRGTITTKKQFPHK